MAIITLQHHDRGVPGRLGMTLRDHGFKLDVRRVDLPRDKGGKPVPTDLDDAHGLIILGGPQNVTDPLPWIQEEQALIRAAHARQLPIIGICLGCQQIAAALGGEVGPMASPELGMTRVALNTIGQVEPMLGGIAWDSMQFQSHAYEVKKLPPGATLLASSKACNVQAFRAGLRTFAFQYHFECDLGAIESYLAADKDDLAKVGLTPAQALDDARRAYEMFARLADRLCVNLATFAFPVVKKLSA